MLKNIDPPLGFGNKCPNRLAYKKLIRMNMPVDDDKKVNFTTTLFALIRENLSIKMRPGMDIITDIEPMPDGWRMMQSFFLFTAEEMDQADEELRETIQMIWPFQARKMLDLLIPRTERLNRNNLSVGKIYAGLLILESWRNTRFGQIDSGIPVSVLFTFACVHSCRPMFCFLCSCIRWVSVWNFKKRIGEFSPKLTVVLKFHNKDCSDRVRSARINITYYMFW